MELGIGLTKDKLGLIALDLNTSLVWSNNHTFLKPLTFAPQQRFLATSFIVPQQERGDLFWFDGNIWNRLPIGAAHQVITTLGGIPRWGVVDLSVAVSGTLHVSHGGTGWKTPPPNGIVVASEKKLTTVPLGDESTFLSVQDGELCWVESTGLQGKGSEGHLASWDSSSTLKNSIFYLEEGVLTWQSRNPGMRFTDVLSAGFRLQDSGQSLKLGINYSTLGHRVDGCEGAVFQIDLKSSKNNPVFAFVYITESGAAKTVASWNRQGVMTTGQVPSNRLTGILGIKQGGTGIAHFSTGDMLYADGNGSLARLSAYDKDGCYLKLENGIPTWSKFQTGVSNISALSFPSELNYDGSNLFYVGDGSANHQFVFQGDDIKGNAAGLSTILTPSMGGTGSDLSSLPVGAIVTILSPTSFGSIEPGPEGWFLASSGNGNLPIFKPVLTSIRGKHDGGIIVDVTESTPCVVVDTSSNFNPSWGGVHTFHNQINFNSNCSILKSINVHSCVRTDVPLPGDIWREGDDLLYRRNGTTINLTTPSNTTVDVKSEHCHYIQLCHGISPKDGLPWRIKTIIPYDTKNCIDKVEWRVYRVDFRSETPAQESPAKLDILVNECSLFSTPLELDPAAYQTFSINFGQTSVFAGDLITVVCRELAQSDYWSVWMLIGRE